MSTPDASPPSGPDRTPGLSGVKRAGLVLGALAVVLIAFVILRGGDSSGGGSSSSDTGAQTATTSATSTGSQGPGTSGSTSGTTTTAPAGSGETGSTATTGTTGTTGTGTEGTGTSTATSTPARQTVPTIRVANGKPQGGVKRLTFRKGDRIRFKVESDVADEVHVHGYDLKKDVTAGGSVQFAFTATIEGRFEIELEHAHTQIAMLEVTP